MSTGTPAWRTASFNGWDEDLTILAEGIRSLHKNAFHHLPEPAFEERVSAIRERLPDQSPVTRLCEFIGLLAAIGDGHTRLPADWVPGLNLLPLTVEGIGDGYALTALPAEHRHLLGSQIVAINDHPIAEASTALNHLLSRDNAMGILAGIPALLVRPEILHAVGILERPDHATLHVIDAEVQTHQLDLALDHQPETISLDDLESVPLWRKDRNTNWFQPVTGTNAIYAAVNGIGQRGDQPFPIFIDRLFTAIDQQRAKRLILDLRHNHGGNNLLNQQLIHNLIRNDTINRWGGLFCIIGRYTFSAAMNLVTDLERHTNVLFVGEPSGSSPNHYGEVGELPLPNTGLQPHVSRFWWQPSWPNDTRPWVQPDLPAPLGATDLANGYDPCLHAALNYEQNPALELGYPDRLFSANWT